MNSSDYPRSSTRKETPTINNRTIENQLLGGRKSNSSVSNSSSRQSTLFEIPALKRSFMQAGNQRDSLGVTLLRVNAVKDMMVSGTVTPTRRIPKPQLNKWIGFNKKPPFSTVKLVAQALLTSSQGGFTRREIEKWISGQYPYYHSTKHKSSVANALSKCEFFLKQPHFKWSIREEYRIYLNENAHLPDYVKKIEWSGCKRLEVVGPTSATTIGPKQYQPQTMFVDKGSEIDAEFPPAVELLPNENQYVASDPSVRVECQNRPHHGANLVDVSSQKTEPRKPNTPINLLNAVNNPPQKKMKVEAIFDIEDENEISIINNAFPLAEKNITKTVIQCPICNAEFNSKESLCDHVSSHSKTPSDPTKIARDAIQNVASLFGGLNRSDSSPIFVFSGNVYFNNSNSPTS